MSEYFASISWQRNEEDFLGNKYSRAHRWQFDGGFEVRASASPHIVPAPWSEAANVDPEEAFVASIASCHMLFFLSIASSQGYQIEEYCDDAVGTLSKDSDGNLSMTEVKLNPRIAFSGDKLPDDDAITAMHDSAHHQCFIANSVKSKVSIHSG